jgi:hypothetical protein
MKELHDLIVDSEDELVEAWLGSYEPGRSRPTESNAARHVRSSLLELGDALKSGVEEASPDRVEDPEADKEPALDSVAAARAYGALHGRILEACSARGVEVRLGEHRVLAAWAHGAVALAIAAERRWQEVECRRLAHDLRNPLGSALMALTLLRPRIPLADGTRLADTLERNLKRIEGVINEDVVHERAAADHSAHDHEL